MTRDEIGQVAACRGELVVQITEGGRDRWLLCSQLPCSLAELAGSLSSDAYEAWRAGEMVVTDKDGKVLVDNFTDDWRRREPLHFRRRDDNNNMMNELIIPLPNGGSLRCGEGEATQWGGYIRICDPAGNEILYWDVTEWEEDGESVIGAAFAASLKSIEELTSDRKLVDWVWVFDKTK